MILLPSY
jgi:hypothetical protein